MNKKDLRERGRAVIKALCQHFPGGTEVKRKNASVKMGSFSAKIRTESFRNQKRRFRSWDVTPCSLIGTSSMGIHLIHLLGIRSTLKTGVCNTVNGLICEKHSELSGIPRQVSVLFQCFIYNTWGTYTSGRGNRMVTRFSNACMPEQAGRIPELRNGG